MPEPRPVSPQRDLLHLSGGPLNRGLAQSGLSDASTAAAVGRSIRNALDTAGRAGLLDDAARDYLSAQLAFHRTEGPAIIAEIDGLAEGFGLSPEDIVAFHHLGLLDVLKTGKARPQDGCSAWAIAEGPDGPLLVKNRDSAAVPDRPQRVMAHQGPEIPGGAMICVGTLGSPGAYSSGMNAAGLAVADTHVTAESIGIGWLRLFLATHLLTHFTTVTNALTYIGQVPHAGGGTLVMADRVGSVAAVDFGAGAVSVSQSARLWRTNHFATPRHRAPGVASDAIDDNSLVRFDYLGRSLSAGAWDISRAMGLMATHDGAPLCQHRATEDAETLSTAIYACRDGMLTFSDSNPCKGNWRRFEVGTWSSACSPSNSNP